jgi:hypothetical protein
MKVRSRAQVERPSGACSSTGKGPPGLFSGTTKSLGFLPPEAKNRLFELVIEKRSTDVVSEFLKSM